MRSFSQYQRYLLPMVIASLLIMLATISFSPTFGFFDEPRVGYDPLSSTEILRAIELADSDAIVQSTISGRQTHHLLIERHEEDKATYELGQWDRRADVFIYDYERNRTVHAIVNLTTETVDTVSTSTSLRLPITEAETARALELALADPQVGPLIRSLVDELNGESAFDASTLQVRAFTTNRDTLFSTVLQASHQCDVHRCAQLMIAMDSTIMIDVIPLVDLSTGTLVDYSRFEEVNNE